MDHTPTPWVYDGECGHIVNAAGFACAMEMTDADAERIVACVNACADIPTESLTALDWQLAPKAGARPVEVAKLLLKMGVYRNAMAKIANMETPRDDESKDSLAEALSVAIEIAINALKP